MALTPERKVKDKVVAILREHGAYYFFPPSNGFGRAGIPDIVICHRGRFIAVECKAGSNKPTALQLRELDNIRKAGGVAIVVNEENIHTIAALLEKRND